MSPRGETVFFLESNTTMYCEDKNHSVELKYTLMKYQSERVTRFITESKAHLLTDRNLTLPMSFKTSSMLGISGGFGFKTVWPSFLFPLRSLIRSMAENVRWRLGGGSGGGGGGGGGGGAREPEGGGGGGGAPAVAAEVKQRKYGSLNRAKREILLPPSGKSMLPQQRHNTG